MAVGYFEFPTREEWKRIYKGSSFEKIFSLLDDFGAKKHVPENIDGFTRAIELSGHCSEIRQRIADTARSYILMMFYYEKGIPDKQWYVSPGRNGESVQYYPDFKEVHFSIKRWFDFYSDTLYYKLFSAWDLIGHALNVKYNLGIGKVDFGQAIGKLQNKDTNLHACLKGVKDSPAYQRANRIRNDITHNLLPNTPGTAVYRDKSARSTTFGLKRYVTSEEIVANIQETLEAFAVTVQCISK